MQCTAPIPSIMYAQVPKTLMIHQPINVEHITRYCLCMAGLGLTLKEMPEPIIVDGENLYVLEVVPVERREEHAPSDSQVSRSGCVVRDVGFGGEHAADFFG